jgi:hypothetical protein
VRFAEIQNGKVRHVGGGPDYTVLPIGAVEIPEEADVQEGMIQDGETFRWQTAEEIAAEHRPAFDAERERQFAGTDWIRQRHADRSELAIDDAANWTAWLEYWQTLRDMPDQPDFDPANPVWPEKPE